MLFTVLLCIETRTLNNFVVSICFRLLEVFLVWRFRMKRLFTVLALAAVLAFAAAPASAKTLRLAVDADPVSLDPHVQLSGGMLQYSHLVFDPLVRWNQEMGFDPRLATKWERIDDKTMRFHLRKGVKFHSGNEFTAKDVAWTLDRLKGSIDFKGLFEVFEPAVVVDDFTVDLKTKVPYPLLINMATYIMAMDSKFFTGKVKMVRIKASSAKPVLHLLTPTLPVLVLSLLQNVNRALKWFSKPTLTTGLPVVTLKKSTCVLLRTKLLALLPFFPVT
jgi:hypothetical protein